jgi:hypothetical protein
MSQAEMLLVGKDYTAGTEDRYKLIIDPNVHLALSIRFG